ncbi:unnamed protein product, partial [Medioppia subpectinata]
MILVLIMAFCLASIATLYVLEYHRRHSHHPTLQDTQQSPTYANSNTHSSPVNTHNSPFTLLPHSVSTPGVTYPDPQSIMQSTDKRYNPNRDKTHPSSYTTASTITRGRPTSIPILKPQVLGIPYSCLDMNTVISSCPTH